MRTRTLAAALAAVVCCLGSAAPAVAGSWKRVTTADQSSSDQVGLARTADGVLHVVWHHPTGPLSEDLLHTAIAPSGKLGGTTAIATGWTDFEDAALVAAPGGLLAFAGAIRSTDTGDPNVGLNAFASSDGGATWALQAGSIVPDGGQAYGSDVSATALPGGGVLQAWAGTLGTWVHAGLSPATPNFDYQAPLGPYGYQPGLATGADGSTAMAWYSNAGGHLGVQAQAVAADGSPLGAAATMPGTGEMQVGTIARTAIAARPGGGFFVAYPTGYPSLNRVRVWRVGRAKAPVIARTSGSGNQPVTVAAAPDGRLWVAWADQFTRGTRVLVRRSNRKGTRFGAVVSTGRPVSSPSGAYSLDASAAPDGGLDLLGGFGIGTTSNAATFYRRVRAGLSLAAHPAVLRRGEPSRVRFVVTDAGEPVKGALVKVGGARGRTNGKGRVSLVVRGAGSRLRARATHKGYTGVGKRLRVRG